jgi:hypothetical protein
VKEKIATQATRTTRRLQTQNRSTANLSPPKKTYKNTPPKRERKTHTPLNTQKTQTVIAPQRERKMTNNSSCINTHFSIHHKFRKQNKHTNHQQLSSTLYSRRAAASGTQEKSKEKSFDTESVCHHHQITS